MRGIEEVDLDNVRKRIDEYILSVGSDIEIINKELLFLIESYEGNDLDFLTAKLSQEFVELNQTKQNNINYSLVLSEVIKSYQLQNEKLKESLSDVTPQHMEGS
ncbi:MAG: hypothetical protein R3Y21_03155 [Mycoplasmatota bacterium]